MKPTPVPPRAAGTPATKAAARNRTTVDAERAPGPNALAPKTRRRNDPEKTRKNILDIATEEFCTVGLAGARVDAIAARTNTTKRMIYYYFGSKEGLYQAVLDQAYAGIRDAEAALQSNADDPDDAMRALVELTFDYHDANPNFIRLVGIENFHRGTHIKASATMPKKNRKAIDRLESILKQGAATGQFRDDIDVINLHMLISSFCYHRISNQHTFGALFGRDPLAPARRGGQREMLVEAVLRYVAR